jgi:hypothetical protein
MSNRSWFYAANGQQQGPYPEAQLRDLITRGMVGADTLVWTEGMSGWQRAGDIPGLVPGGGSSPPSFAQPGGPPSVATGGYSGGPLSIDFGILEFVWRSLALAIGLLLIIPGPWVVVWYAKWIVPQVQVPGRPNLGFEGQAMTIVPWYFGAVVVFIAVGLIGNEWLSNLLNIAQLALYWLFVKWFIANLSSNGQPLGLSFVGSVWAYVGWSILAVISVITIVGWAWVYVAMMRWFCRNIEGTRREVLFIGSGLEFLWRAVVSVIGFFFIIPIPWVYRWMMQWLASQTVLAERGDYANA